MSEFISQGKDQVSGVPSHNTDQSNGVGNLVKKHPFLAGGLSALAIGGLVVGGVNAAKGLGEGSPENGPAPIAGEGWNTTGAPEPSPFDSASPSPTDLSPEYTPHESSSPTPTAVEEGPSDPVETAKEFGITPEEYEAIVQSYRDILSVPSSKSVDDYPYVFAELMTAYINSGTVEGAKKPNDWQQRLQTQALMDAMPPETKEEGRPSTEYLEGAYLLTPIFLKKSLDAVRRETGANPKIEIVLDDPEVTVRGVVPGAESSTDRKQGNFRMIKATLEIHLVDFDKHKDAYQSTEAGRALILAANSVDEGARFSLSLGKESVGEDGVTHREIYFCSKSFEGDPENDIGGLNWAIANA